MEAKQKILRIKCTLIDHWQQDMLGIALVQVGYLKASWFFVINDISDA